MCIRDSGWESEGKAAWEDYWGDRGFNLGFAGDRTENVLWRIEHGALENLDPKLTVLLIGTNNTGHRMDPPENAARGVRKILDELEQRLPESRVLLLAIFPRGTDAADLKRQNNDGINALTRGFADGDRVTWLDLSGQFMDEAGALKQDIMPDLLHLNEEGYAAWAAAMNPVIEELLSSR